MNHWERVTPPASVLADELATRVSAEVRRVSVSELLTGSAEETGRRLDQLLHDAQESGAVLLLDEADALFGRRTEVQDAHDRHEHTEADVLVDRLATFRGSVFVVPPDSE